MVWRVSTYQAEMRPYTYISLDQQKPLLIRMVGLFLSSPVTPTTSTGLPYIVPHIRRSYPHGDDVGFPERLYVIDEETFRYSALGYLLAVDKLLVFS